MKITEFYKTRNDGVNLYLTVDAKVDEEGNVIYEYIKDDKGEVIGKKPILRGYYILQNETQTLYVEAIDVEKAPYTYSETDIPIEVIETSEENITE